MKKHIWSICFSAVLIAFTVYIALDTFVIRRVYDDNAVEMNTSLFTEAPKTALTADGTGNVNATDQPYETETPGTVISEPEIDENSYHDGKISIEITEYEKYGTAIYVADVTVSSAEYFRTAFANDKYGRNITAVTSEIARSNDAIIAVNGDFYGSQQKGFVIRNGVVYRSSARGDDVLCVYADGTMKIVNDRDKTAEELVDEGVWQAFTFGPSLIEDGNITVGEKDEVDIAMASNPRTALGMIDANHFLFVVSDGRTSESEGLSLYELATFMKDLGASVAYNLDGGGSSTMYFNGSVINNPTSGGKIKERKVSDIVYIGA